MPKIAISTSVSGYAMVGTLPNLEQARREIRLWESHQPDLLLPLQFDRHQCQHLGQ
jgi:hypothetical protein